MSRPYPSKHDNAQHLSSCAQLRSHSGACILMDRHWVQPLAKRAPHPEELDMLASWGWYVTGSPAVKTGLFVTAKGCPTGQQTPQNTTAQHYTYTDTLTAISTLPAAYTKPHTTFSIGLGPQKQRYKNRPKCAETRRRVWTNPCLDKGQGGGGGLAQSLSIRLFAFGGAYWPLATVHSDPLCVQTCFGCVNGAPG